MRDNLPACLAFTLAHEGGWSDHPSDPGGATMRGVTLATFRRYVPGATKSDLRAISDEDLRRIYRAGYWVPVGGDDLPAGVDLVAFDIAVNSGPGRALRWLADTATVTPPVARIKALCRRRLSFWQSLRTWSVFGRGWARRGAACEAEALRMAGASPEAMVRESARASASVGRAKTATNATAASGAGGSVAAVTSPSDAGLWIAAAIVGAAILISVLFYVRSVTDAARAKALAEAASDENQEAISA